MRWLSFGLLLAAMIGGAGKARANTSKPTVRIECGERQSAIQRVKGTWRLVRWRDCSIEIEWDAPVFYAGLRTHCDPTFNPSGGAFVWLCNLRHPISEGGDCYDFRHIEGGVMRDSIRIYAGKYSYKQLEIMTGFGPDAVCYKRTLENDALYPCNDKEPSDCGGFQTDAGEDTWGAIKALIQEE